MVYCSKCRIEERYMPTNQFARFTRANDPDRGNRYDFCGGCFHEYRALKNKIIDIQRAENNGFLPEKVEFSPLIIDVDGEHVLTECNYDIFRRWLEIKKHVQNISF